MWFSNFNKVVRSHEALCLGLLVGVITGVMLMITVSIPIKHENWKTPITHCGKIDNVDSANFSYMGEIRKVICKDKRIFKNF